MARARTGGVGTGWVVATVIMSFAFVVCLILMVILATQVRRAQQDSDSALSDLEKFVKRTERSSDVVNLIRSQAAEQRKSVVGLLTEENRELKRKIRSEDSTLKSIDSAIEALGLSDDALLNHIRRLQANLTDTAERLADADGAREQAEKDLGTRENEKAEAAQQYEQAVTAIKQDLEALRQSYQEYQQSKDELISQLEVHLQDVRDQTADEVRQLTSTLGQKDVEMRGLKARIDEILQKTITEGGGGQTGVVQADGKIVTINRDEDLVYVNLSRHDRVQPAMTFEVFDKNELIRHDEENDVRGKATIELIRVLDSSSVARVVRVEPRANFTVGDQIVNVAYDRNAVFRFYVHGTFDVDNTGTSTMADNRRVKMMIERWGSQVTKELNYQTDYLVLGQDPARPEPPPEDASIDELQTYTELRRVYERYRQLVDGAERLKIPILNQNRFLGLVGYYYR